jgi:predicted dehydrogenase/threonine dehydrogenase-like Zn-dependent dehydrogenase
MKQLLQNMRDGKTCVTDIPLPAVRPKTALIRTAASLVSAGTERMLVEFAEKSLLGKARSRPDLLRQVVDKARREGVLPTLEAAFNRLDKPMPLGYSSAGTIVEAGEGLRGFQVGDRVACAGGNYAVHADYAVVPQNLLALLPTNVDFESAAFTTLGAIALHGFRLAKPQLGERVAVIGLGLLGLLAVQIARAASCDVFGVDVQPERVTLARQLGFAAALRKGCEPQALAFSSHQGFDIVLICADAHSNDPVELAGTLARDRGQVVAIGAFGMDIPRKIYYDKELLFLISRSYGPGRYDPEYEENGRDYPIGFVRWTEGRNLTAVVDLLSSDRLDVRPLITHRIPLEDASKAYDLITGKIKEPFLGVLLTYPQKEETLPANRVIIKAPSTHQPSSSISIGVLGAGNYATAVFLPLIHKAGGVTCTGIASASGITSRHAAQKFGFQYATSSDQEILENKNINLVVILTRHQDHSRQVIQALQHGKAVYCEKPLAITPQQLDEILALLQDTTLPLLTVGFNRRFAPLSQRLNEFVQKRSEPLAAYYRINAGYLPLSHWLHDPAQGGGRIIGEGCHFVDFLTYLIGAPPTHISAHKLPDNGRYLNDNVVLTFTFPDGSLGTISYLANGDKSFPKEQVEIFTSGGVAVLNDFRSLEIASDGHRRVFKSRLKQDKGHSSAWAAFLSALKTGSSSPIPYDQLIGVARATFAVEKALQTGEKSSI